jgi:LmbE family N-acetylglucosaminyl deacetylase
VEVVPEDWQRALAIVAHPDDMEYGAASAVARWTAQGKEISYVLATRGEHGIDSLDPDECARVREAEELASAGIVGVAAVEFLRHDDGVIEYGTALRRDFALAIRRHRPDVVITLHYGERWGGGWLNMADHRNVGLAVLDAVRDAGNKWIFGGTHGTGPWNGVRFVLVAGSSAPTHFVDVSQALEPGIASLEAHAQYLAHVGTNARTFLTESATTSGAECGVQYATQFELIPF